MRVAGHDASGADMFRRAMHPSTSITLNVVAGGGLSSPAASPNDVPREVATSCLQLSRASRFMASAARNAAAFARTAYETACFEAHHASSSAAASSTTSDGLLSPQACWVEDLKSMDGGADQWTSNRSDVRCLPEA